MKSLKLSLPNENKSFAFEITCAGINYVKYLKSAKSKGYQIVLFFLWLDNPKQAVKRVAQRVKQGGHHIPKEVIFRRYKAGLKNFLTVYLPLADVGAIMNNSTDKLLEKVIASKNITGEIDILNMKIWKKINKIAYER